MVTRYEVPNKIRAMGSLMQADELLSMVMASEYDALQLERDQLKEAAQMAATVLQQIIDDDNSVILYALVKEGHVALVALYKVGVLP